MKKQLTLIILSVLMVFAMACSLTSNLLNNVESSVNDIVEEAADAVDAVVMDEAAEVLESMGESEEDLAAENMSSESDESEAVIEDESSLLEESEDVSLGGMDGAVTSGPCYNPYFPIVEDRTLIYQNRINEISDWESSHTMTFRDVTDDEFTAVFSYYEVDLEGIPLSDEMIDIGISWSCTEEGMQQQEFMFGNFGPVDELVEISYETIEFKGITFPAEENFVVGATWDADYVIEMVTTVDGVAVTSQIAIHQVNTVAGLEEVSVLYGNYSEALRVDSVMDLTMSTMVDGASHSIDTTSEVSTWYVRDVGMVKQVDMDGSQGITYIQELADIQ